MTRSMIALSLLVIGMLVLGSYHSSRKAQTERDKISDLKREISSLQDEIKLLRLEVAHLGSDTTIEAIAREKLGMRLPDPDQIIPISEAPTRPEARP